MLYIKLAFRNLLRQGKRSALIGASIALSCVILILGFSLANGAERALLDRFRDTRSGEVAVAWSNIQDYAEDDMGRLMYSAFDFKQGGANEAAIEALDAYLAQRADEVEAVYRPLTFFAMMDCSAALAPCFVHGAGREELSFLLSAAAIELWGGKELEEGGRGIWVHESFARKQGKELGDWVWIEASTAAGLVNSKAFRIEGIMKNGAPWDELVIYMDRGSAFSLTESPPDSFGSARIMLKDPSLAPAFAAGLDEALALAHRPFEAAGKRVLLALEGKKAQGVFAELSVMLKGIFGFFSFFLLAVIAMGQRSAVRMSFFERIKEFGAMRALGYGRSSGFSVMFAEVSLLSLGAFAFGLLISLVTILIVGQSGFHMGSGSIAYIFGGEYVKASVLISDVALAAALSLLSAFFAMLKPALRFSRRSIVDLLSARRGDRAAIPDIIASLIRRTLRALKSKKAFSGTRSMHQGGSL